MKMIKNIYFLGILLVIAGCSQKQIEEYTIIGSINKEYDGNKVMLFILLGDSIIAVDTTIIINGSFKFHGKEYIRDFSVITTGNFPDKVLSAEVILEKGKIKVDLDSISVVSGPLLQTSYKSYVDSFNFLYKEIEKTYQIANSKFTVMNDRDFAEASKGLNTYLLRVIRANANNVIGKHAFGYYCYTASDEELSSTYAMFDESTKSEPYIIFLLNDRLRVRSESVKSKEILNTDFKDFELLATDGSTKRISDYVGKSKYLLIDFWASWCGPCVRDFPYLKKIYDEFLDKDLIVLGISLDSSETAWKNAVETHHISWETLMAKNEKEMYDAYLFNGIPYGILLDDKGTIIEVGLIGQTLAPTIRKYLK